MGLMSNALKKALIKTEEQPSEVLTAIREVCRQLESARLRFEMESDNDLIEACIYEMEALRARYRYVLRVAREEGVRAPGLSADRAEEEGKAEKP